MIGFQPGTNPLSLYDELRTLAAPVTTFFSGGKFADRSQAMDQNLKDTIMSQYDKTGIMSGNIGYSDFDKNQTPGTEFPNLDAMRSNLFSGDMSLPAFSNATTLGRVNYDIDPNTGKVNFGSNAYNFRPEMATIDPSDPYGQQAFSYFAGKANERNREINPDISIPVDYLRGFGKDFSQFGDPDGFRSRMERMSNNRFDELPSTRQTSSPRAAGAEDIKEEGILQALVSKFGDSAILDYIKSGGMIGEGITGLKNMFGDIFKGSSFYNPKTASGNRLFAPGARMGDQTDLGFRRDAASISRMLNRLAAGKPIGHNRLADIMGKFGLSDVDTNAMSRSIAESAKTGYGGHGSSDAAAAAASTGGRDYSNSPGAMAGDMEYGEE